MAGSFRGNHRNINVRRRLDFVEMDVETVGEHQGLAGRKTRSNIVPVNLALQMVRKKDHDEICCLRCLTYAQNAQPCPFSLLFALASCMQAHNDLEAGVAQVQCVCMSLAAVSDDRNGLALERRKASVLFVVSLWHLFPKLSARGLGGGSHSASCNSNTSSGAAPRAMGGDKRNFLLSSDIDTTPDRVASVSP